MDAVEYLRNFDSMCKSYESCCYRCPISRVNNCTKYYCRDYITQFPEKAVQIVEQWTEKQKNTRQKEFLKTYPNAKILDGIININPCNLDTVYREKFCDNYTKCKECRKDYWFKEVDKK